MEIGILSNIHAIVCYIFNSKYIKNQWQPLLHNPP